MIRATASLGLMSTIAGSQTAAAQVPPAAPSPATGLPERGEFVIRNAFIISVDPTLGDLPKGDIHVRNGEIVAIAAEIPLAGVPTIEAKGMIATPGLIETHWHMWGTVLRNMAGEEEKTGYYPYSRDLGMVFTPEDNARAIRLALAEAIYGGLTTVHNWSHNLLTPAHTDAEIAAHRAFGGRARFAYGYSRKTKANEILPLDDIARVQKQYFTGGDGLLTLGMASLGPESNNLENCKKEWGAARRLGISITSHMGTKSVGPALLAGVANAAATFQVVDGIKLLSDNGLLGPDVIIVHATNCSKENFDMMARTNTPVSSSPFTEMRTGFGFPPVLAMMAAGIKPSLSVDTTLLCGNADMFAIMKAMQNVADGTARSEFGITPRRVLEMATMGGAQALGIADKVGSLTPGKRADILLIRTDALNMAPFTEPVRMVVQAAQPQNVDTVIIDGRVLKREGRLTAIDAGKVMADAQDTIDRVRAQVHG
jgi:cytosine/adenosine deaminase-related metal-dependent hydrolase